MARRLTNAAFRRFPSLTVGVEIPLCGHGIQPTSQIQRAGETALCEIPCDESSGQRGRKRCLSTEEMPLLDSWRPREDSNFRPAD